VYADVSDEVNVQNLIDETMDFYGQIDGVHCNAAVWEKGTVTEFDESTWNKLMGVNVKGVLWTVKHAVPIMEKQGRGVIVITTSMAATMGFPAHVVYSASKAALEAVVRCLAVDHAGKIRAVGISPGAIDTPMMAASWDAWRKDPSEGCPDISKKIPVRRIGRPEDVARAAAFLLSDEASYINGTTIALDGGASALSPW